MKTTRKHVKWQQILSRVLVLFLAGMMSTFASAQCDADEVEVELTISTDDWGYEVYWEVVPEGNNCGDGTVASGGNTAVGCNGGGAQDQAPGGYGNNDEIVEGPWCLVEGESYTLIYVDDYGDGGADFSVNIENFPLYNYTGTGDGNSWTFVAQGPSERDAAVTNVVSYGYATVSVTPAIFEVTNYGSTTITSVSLHYNVGGAQQVTESFESVNILPFESELVTFDDNLNLSYGSNIVEVNIESVNGQNDENPSNDFFEKELILGNPIPNLVDGYLNTDVSISVINDGANVDTPRDLDFHPTLTNFELWIINKGTENSGGSTIRFENAGFPNQTYEEEQDGNAWHFMSLPTAIAFGENENFGTSPGVYDANHDGGQPFTGPSLWSSVDEIYAEPSGGNGSHLDMLHVSPYSQGMAHEVDNVYWVVDGNSNDIVRYDFADDHGPGNSFHGDAIIYRYADFEIAKDPNNHIVSHCVLDKSSNWLYVVDHGNARVLRMDITTGTIAGVPTFGPFEAVDEYNYVTGYTWEVIIDQDLVEPAGIDVVGNRLLVSDHATGEVVIYDMDNSFEELGRVATGDPGIMGIKVGPWGRIWFVNATTDEVGIIEGNPLIVDDKEVNLNFSVYPNPASDVLNVSFEATPIQYRISSLQGDLVSQKRIKSSTQLQLDVRSLSAGTYILTILFEDGESSTPFIVGRK